jgi:hypothetical protein
VGGSGRGVARVGHLAEVELIAAVAPGAERVRRVASWRIWREKPYDVRNPVANEGGSIRAESRREGGRRAGGSRLTGWSVDVFSPEMSCLVEGHAAGVRT